MMMGENSVKNSVFRRSYKIEGGRTQVLIPTTTAVRTTHLTICHHGEPT